MYGILEQKDERTWPMNKRAYALPPDKDRAVPAKRTHPETIKVIAPSSNFNSWVISKKKLRAREHAYTASQAVFRADIRDAGGDWEKCQ